jgi:hypothetical protein
MEICYISWVWVMWDVNSPPIFNYFNICEEGLGLWGPVPVGVRATRYPPFVGFPSFFVAPGPEVVSLRFALSNYRVLV